MLRGQLLLSQPNALAWFLDDRLKLAPGLAFVGPDQIGTFLMQDILPVPFIQLAQHLHRAELLIPDQQHLGIGGQQFPNGTQ